MTQKEIEKLRNRVYAISYSKFPLNMFFNDINLNKDTNYNKEMAYEDLKLITDEIYRLKELEKTPTLEEVKQEWEELGYEWRIPKEYPHMIWLVNDNEEEKWVLTIRINTQSKKYWKLWGDGDFDKFTLQEHQLLTKTFRALGWFDE